MSEINGDKARFNKARIKKAHQRQEARDLLKAARGEGLDKRRTRERKTPR